jgi:hypothetical protein
MTTAKPRDPMKIFCLPAGSYDIIGKGYGQEYADNSVTK